MKHYHITNSLAVNAAFALRLASLDYDPGSNRPDDAGSLYVAPVSKSSCEAPVGLLAIYASTNCDPILVGQVEDGDVTWFDHSEHSEGLSDSMNEVLARACWLDEQIPNEAAAELAEIIRNALPEIAE
jgi:hypothetical protein